MLLWTLLAHPVCKLERVLIRERGKVHVIPVNQIDYVEAQDDYINIHSARTSLLKTQSLSELEAQLDSSKVVRIHRSYLIRIEALKGLARAGYERLKSML